MFTNSIMTTCVNRFVHQPLMNSIDVGGYKNTDAENPRGGYQKPYVIIAKIPILVIPCALFLIAHSKIIFCCNLTFKLHFKRCKSTHDEFPVDLG